jgi:hypothetical protein
MGMAIVNRTRPRCVNQMGKTQSKPLAARRDMATAAMCYSCEGGLVTCRVLNN